MKFSLLILAAVVTAKAFYTMMVYAPEHPEIHERRVNARNRKFIIGASRPSTYCGSRDTRQCPPGNTTLIDKDMTSLAVHMLFLRFSDFTNHHFPGLSPWRPIHLRLPRRPHILPLRALLPPPPRLQDWRLPPLEHPILRRRDHRRLVLGPPGRPQGAVGVPDIS